MPRATWTWTFDLPPERLWPVLADTNRFNEAMGLPAYALEETPRADGTVLRRGRGKAAAGDVKFILTDSAASMIPRSSWGDGCRSRCSTWAHRRWMTSATSRTCWAKRCGIGRRNWMRVTNSRACMQNWAYARLTASAAWDSRNDPAAPTRGMLITSSLESAPAGLGSEIRFVRAFLGTAHAFLLHHAEQVGEVAPADGGAGPGAFLEVLEELGVVFNVLHLGFQALDGL